MPRQPNPPNHGKSNEDRQFRREGQIRNHVEAREQEMKEWIAQDPENRFGGCTNWACVESLLDSEFNQVETYEEWLQYNAWIEYYEAYKYVNGFRDRSSNWRDCSTEEWDSLVAEMCARANREEAEDFDSQEPPYSEEEEARTLAIYSSGKSGFVIGDILA